MLWSLATVGGSNLFIVACVGSQGAGHDCAGFSAWSALAMLGACATGAARVGQS
jgi:hypothetical protein